MGDSRHFKFGTQINNSKYYPTDNYPKGGGYGHVTTF